MDGKKLSAYDFYKKKFPDIEGFSESSQNQKTLFAVADLSRLGDGEKQKMDFVLHSPYSPQNVDPCQIRLDHSDDPLEVIKDIFDVIRNCCGATTNFILRLVKPDKPELAELFDAKKIQDQSGLDPSKRISVKSLSKEEWRNKSLPIEIGMLKQALKSSFDTKPFDWLRDGESLIVFYEYKNTGSIKVIKCSNYNEKKKSFKDLEVATHTGLTALDLQRTPVQIAEVLKDLIDKSVSLILAPGAYGCKLRNDQQFRNLVKDELKDKVFENMLFKHLSINYYKDNFWVFDTLNEIHASRSHPVRNLAMNIST